MTITSSRIDYRVGDNIHQARLVNDESLGAKRPGVINFARMVGCE